MSSQQVQIFDITLRKGEQSPEFSMKTQDKVLVAKQLDQLKVDIIEADFPISSPNNFEGVKTISQVVEYAEVCGLARVMEKDVATAWETIEGVQKPRIDNYHLGKGSVAAYCVLNQIINLSNSLLEHSVSLFTERIEVQTVVSVSVQVDDKLYTGNNGNTDIDLTTLKIYWEALNKTLNNFSKIKQESTPNS